jgi:type IV secretory pathway VirB3-like protein
MDNLEAPVYHSILTPPLTVGVPNTYFLFLLVSGMGIVISLSQWWFVVPLVIFLLIGRIVTDKDVFNLAIILKLIKIPEALD